MSWVCCMLLMSACGGTDSANPPGSAARQGDKALNLYIWSDYLAPKELPDFEKQTGVPVHVSYYDTNETLETRLLAGHSGFDVVVPTASFFERQIKAGVYLTLDKSKLQNLRNMDAELMAKAANYDPGNAHGIIYAYGTIGLGYNEKRIKALLPEAPLDSWRLVLDPAIASKIASCGISVLDSPAEMLRVVLSYLGRDANSKAPADLALAQDTLAKIRPYVRNINSSEYIEALANGDLCAAVGYNGDVLQARNRAHEAGNGIDVGYQVPKEGSVLWFDMLAIPKDAPDVESAYAFMNYVMTPQVSADISDTMHFATANAAALPLVLASIRNDPGVYPPQSLVQRLSVQQADSPDENRAIVRAWQKFKTGQ